MNLVDWWPVAVAIGVLWTLVVLVYDAGRSNKPALRLWREGAVVIVAAAVASLALAGVIRP